MNREAIQRKFTAMGARVVIRDEGWLDYYEDEHFGPGDLDVNILNGKSGEYYELIPDGPMELTVLDIKPRDRHLLLMARFNELNDGRLDETVVKLLCGHDEREWFVSQVPKNPARDVYTAKESLKPALAVQSQAEHGVKRKNRQRRRNRGYIRQGEWFFIPEPNLSPDDLVIRRHEPIALAGVRAGSKPHMAEEAYQDGGETVYVHYKHAPEGITYLERAALFRRRPELSRSGNWRNFLRNPAFYVRGTVRHPDHRTITLRGWHQVVLNTEIRGANVAFLD